MNISSPWDPKGQKAGNHITSHTFTDQEKKGLMNTWEITFSLFRNFIMIIEILIILKDSEIWIFNENMIDFVSNIWLINLRFFIFYKIFYNLIIWYLKKITENSF